MRYAQAQQFIKELNDGKYWCGGSSIWAIRSHARLARTQPEKCTWHPYVAQDHIRARHFECKFFRWRVSLCRQFIKLHIERIDGTHTQPQATS